MIRWPLRISAGSSTTAPHRGAASAQALQREYHRAVAGAEPGQLHLLDGQCVAQGKTCPATVTPAAATPIAVPAGASPARRRGKSRCQRRLRCHMHDGRSKAPSAPTMNEGCGAKGDRLVARLGQRRP